MTATGGQGGGDELTLEERGFVLGATLSGRGLSAASGLSEVGAPRCSAALERLVTLPRGERGERLAQLAAGALPAPPRVAQLHPTWVEHALLGEPGVLVFAVVAGHGPAVIEAAASAIRAGGEDPRSVRPLALAPEMLADLQRLAFSPLAPLLDGQMGPTASRLVALSMSELFEELAVRGAWWLGCSLGGSSVEEYHQALTRIDPSWAASFGEGLRAPATAAAREAVAAAGGQDLRGDRVAIETTLATMALPELRAALLQEGVPSLRRVAGRLPRPLGLRLLASDLLDSVCG